MVQLLGLIRKLPEADQDAVLTLLLQGLTSSDAWQQAVARTETSRRVFPAVIGNSQLRAGARDATFTDGGARRDTKLLPVRLPAETHEQLKTWCEEHGFAMAAVVRGLVDRFLEPQRTP